MRLVLIIIIVFLLVGCDNVQHLRLRTIDSRQVLCVGDVYQLNVCMFKETRQECEKRIGLMSYSKYMFPSDLQEVVETIRAK